MSGTNDLDSLERELAGTGYRVVRALARSAMSDVVVVRRDGQLGEQVLKVVRAPKLGDEDAGADLARRLLAEARALRVLVHPNIVRLLDFGLTAPSGDAGGRPYLVTELLSGRTLSDEVATRRRLPKAEAVGVVLDVLQALDSADRREEVAPTMRVRTPDDTDETRLPRHAADADTAIEPLLDPDAEVQPRLVSADLPYPTQPKEQTPAVSKARERERTAVWMGAAVLILLLLVAVLAWLALQPRSDPPPAIGGASPESPLIARSYLLPSLASSMSMSEPLQPFGHDTIPQSVIERLRTGKFEAPPSAFGPLPLLASRLAPLAKPQP